MRLRLYRVLRLHADGHRPSLHISRFVPFEANHFSRSCPLKVKVRNGGNPRPAAQREPTATMGRLLEVHMRVQAGAE